MTVDELQLERALTEDAITQAMNTFHARTGLYIRKVQIQELNLGMANWDGGPLRPAPVYEAHCVVEL